MRRILFFLPLLFLVLPSSVAQQVKDVINWQYDAKKTGDSTFDVSITANIKEGWHIYTATPGGDGSQVPTTIKFDKNPNIKLVGKTANNGKAVNEEIKELEYSIQYYKNKVTYTQKLIASANTVLKGAIDFQICDDAMCLPSSPQKFQIKIDGLATTAAAVPDSVESNLDTVAANLGSGQVMTPTGDVKTTDKAAQISNADAVGKGKGSLISIFFSGFIQGLIAFITPCIFSMLPITVSFFTKRSKTKAQGLRNATFYALSIILI